MNMQSNTSEPKVHKKAKRSVRNYLLDPHLQLRFTAYVSGVAACSSILLGAFLWHTSRSLVRETQLAVEARSQAIEFNHSLSLATLNNELMHTYNDPALHAAFQQRSKLLKQRMEKEKSAAISQKQNVLREQRAMTWGLIAGLVAFFFLVALGTIVFTHQVAGPIYRIKRTMQNVSKGKLTTSLQLRKRDQVRDLFEEMERMVHALRLHRLNQRQILDSVLEFHQSGQWDAARNKLIELQKLLEEKS